MSLFIFFIFLGTVFCLLIIFLIFAFQNQKENKKREIEIAIHEAGHTIVSWWCSGVEKITTITIEAENGGGLMNYHAYQSTDLAHYWCLLVIYLGGLAAETAVSNNFRTVGADSDLTRAKDLANKISKIVGSINPPWEWIEEVEEIPFQNYYPIPPSSEELIILRQAFEFAKKIIIQQKLDHQKLTELLLERKTITQIEVENLFGSREMIKALGTNKSTFYFPRAKTSHSAS